MLREKNDLTDVIGGVGDGAIQRFDSDERFAANIDGAFEVRGRQGLDRREGDAPRLVPPTEHVAARYLDRHLELVVSIAIRLLAIGGQEIAEPRPQVAGDVLDDD